jgi:long-chain fatty acid transport protein
MKKKLHMLVGGLLAFSMAAHAGGLMTNTNYHIAFDRMMARGATFDIDAAYSNPAGLVWGHQGWQLSLNFQKPWQHRDIEASMPVFLSGEPFQKKYEGVASAPIVPALFAAYTNERWSASAMIGIVGSGGFVEYDEGIPMLNVPIMAKLYATNAMLIPNKTYTLDSKMEGKQYIYGGQLNFAYKLHENIAVSLGMRITRYDGYNRGHVIATANEPIASALGYSQLMNMQLDCKQTGWGIAPILGFAFHNGPLTISSRYEMRTKHNTENDTEVLNINGTDVKALAEQNGTAATVAALAASTSPDMAAKMAAYIPGEKTRYDMPALLAAAIGYEFSDKLRATVEYHFFDDKNAKMAGNRQEALSGGTNEFVLGVEYDINDRFTVSMGGQRTDYGLSDDYQQNTSFACDSWSVGLGGAWNVTDKIRVNAGYFVTLYSDYEKQFAAGNPATGGGYYGIGLSATETYSRTNHVIGIGIDYKF